MITLYFVFSQHTPTMNFDPEYWQCYYDQFHLPKQYANMQEAIKVIDDSILHLVEAVGREDYLNDLFWGLRMDDAPAFFHVTSFRNRYEHMCLYDQLNIFEIET